jgi:hypothetical protein
MFSVYLYDKWQVWWFWLLFNPLQHKLQTNKQTNIVWILFWSSHHRKHVHHQQWNSNWVNCARMSVISLNYWTLFSTTHPHTHTHATQPHTRTANSHTLTHTHTHSRTRTRTHVPHFCKHPLTHPLTPIHNQSHSQPRPHIHIPAPHNHKFDIHNHPYTLIHTLARIHTHWITHWHNHALIQSFR